MSALLRRRRANSTAGLFFLEYFDRDINLHFTGDLHAIGAANNLIAAMLDNHIHQGNALDIDTNKVTWRRCVDMNDRQLRSNSESP